MKFTVGPEDVGLRIDKCAALKLGEAYSRVYVKRLIDNGLLHVNAKEVKPRYIVQKGDEVSFEMLPPETSDIEPEEIPLNILYEDEWIIVLNKPAGMVVHPGAGNKKGTLAGALLFHCGKLADTSDPLRPGIVHRLDKDTSGVIVVAKNDRALRSLAKQFQKRAVKKCYIALVEGRVEMDNGIIDAPLTRHHKDRKKIEIGYNNKGKPARTIYHVVRRFDNFTLLKVEPETGRTHQIRVHMKHLGHPVLGDKQYGCARLMKRQALHAESLIFTHPDTGKTVKFSAPVPDDIQKVIERGTFLE